MSRTANFRQNLGLKILALCLAALLWFSVTLGHNEAKRVSVPVVLENIPPHLVVSGAVPPVVEIELAGPKIVLMTIAGEQLRVVLDLSGAGAGTVSFVNLDRRVQVRSGIRIIRVQPATLELSLVKSGQPHLERTGP